MDVFDLRAEALRLASMQNGLTTKEIVERAQEFAAFVLDKKTERRPSPKKRPGK